MYNQNPPFIQDPFSTPPAVHGVTTPQGFNNLIPLAAAHLVNVIQSKANQNEVRNYYYFLASENYYQNQIFQQAVGQFIDVIVFEAAKLNIYNENAIMQNFQLANNVAELTVRLQSSVQASYNQNLMNTLRPELRSGINDNLMLLQQIKRDLTQPMHQPQPIPQFQNNYQTPQYQQGPQHNTTWVGQAPTNNMGSFNTAGLQNIGVTNRPNPITHNPSKKDMPLKRGGVMQSFGENNAVQNYNTSPRQDFHPHTQNVQPQPQNAYTPPVEAPSAIAPQEPMMQPMDQTIYKVGDYEAYSISNDPSRPYDSLVTADSILLVPAILSTWSKTYNEDSPYGELYNLSTHVKFHVKNGERVEELIVEKSPDMEYINHELKDTQGYVTFKHPDHKRVLTNWDLVSKMHKLPEDNETEILVGEEVVDLKEINDPITDNEIIISNSIEDAEFMFHGKLFNVDVVRDTEMAYEFYTRIVKPVPMQLTEIEEVFNVIKLCTRLSRLLQTFNVSFDMKDFLFWETLNIRFTNEINKTLACKLSLPDWQLDSFFNEYAELLEQLNKRIGPNMSELLEENSSSIIKAVCSQLSSEDILTYCKQKLGHVDPELSLEFSKRFAFFNELISVTYIPWNLSDIDMSLTETPELIKPSVNVKLHSAVTKLFERANGIANGFNHHYLLTKDRKLVEVHKGYLTPNAYLVNLASV